MTIAQPQSWEHSLLTMAREGQPPASPVNPLTYVDQRVIDQAYDYCTDLTANHSRSFYLATSLLPREKRQAMRALYAFCRVSDNIVDEPRGNPHIRLERWRMKALSPRPSLDDPVCLAWLDARSRYRIPLRFAEQLLEGVERDLKQDRYATFDELASYAYGVASTVGLMSQHIIGAVSPRSTPYAIKLGVALQITNILRDVGEDWRSGRLYLPTNELANFSLDEDDIAAGATDIRWRSFMRFQIERNRRLYQEAWPGIAWLHRDGGLAVILDDIEAHDYDVFNRRAHVSSWGKLSRLPGLAWRANRLSPRAQDNAPEVSGHPSFAG